MFSEDAFGQKCVTLDGIVHGAECSMACVKIIRDWLPIEGFTEKPIASQSTVGDWFRQLVWRCSDFFKIHASEGSYPAELPDWGPLYVIDDISWIAPFIAYREICGAMQELRSIYLLDDVDGELNHPYLPTANGQVLPPVSERTLKTIEQASEIMISYANEYRLRQNTIAVDSPKVHGVAPGRDVSNAILQPNLGAATPKQETQAGELADTPGARQKKGIESAIQWLKKSRKNGGPTTSQKTLVSLLINSDGWMSHADLSTSGGFNWENARLGARLMVERIGKKIDLEIWTIDPEENSGCLIRLK